MDNLLLTSTPEMLPHILQFRRTSESRKKAYPHLRIPNSTYNTVPDRSFRYIIEVIMLGQISEGGYTICHCLSFVKTTIVEVKHLYNW